MTKYIDPTDGQIISLSEQEIIMIDNSGVREGAVKYYCYKREMYFCESKRRFDLLYRNAVNMPDTGE